MTNAPERIWIEDEFGDGDDDQWTYGTWDVRNYAGYDVEYVRADLALPAVRPVTLVDRDNILAKALWAQSHAKPWDKWERSSPEVKQSFIDGAARVLSAVQPGKEVMPSEPTGSAEGPRNTAPASTDDAGGGATHKSDCAVHNAPAYLAGPCDCGVAGGGATREEVAEALWTVNNRGFVSQFRPRFADAEIYNRNHWLRMADVAIDKIKGVKK